MAFLDYSFWRISSWIKGLKQLPSTLIDTLLVLQASEGSAQAYQWRQTVAAIDSNQSTTATHLQVTSPYATSLYLLSTLIDSIQ